MYVKWQQCGFHINNPATNVNRKQVILVQKT